ncbi:MAG: peptide chain release factor 1 [Clostridiales bacterium]|nr:peptide chain release factor 1 [Clostridiales bacterium]
MAIDESKLQAIKERYDEVTVSLQDPSVASDRDKFTALSRELADTEEVISEIKRYEEAKRMIAEAAELLNEGDDDLKALADEELYEGKKQAEDAERKINELLMPKDIRDDRSVIMEIRAGTGGEESALFASDLYKMYMGYAARHGFTVNVVDQNTTELGGFKEITFEIKGRKAYSRLKFESGVHRVQRVPVTESGGRIHTSAVTVAVLPEAEPMDVTINPGDLKIDTYRASGAGGQHINKTESAIRITHLPTGIVVTCQDERSQIKNKEKAMAVLTTKLWDMTREAAEGAINEDRRNQVGSGDRSERIRTYNFHQGRVTDHRIGLTLYKLDEILAGDFDEITDALIVAAAADDAGR